MHAISLRALEVRYGGHAVIAGLDLEVARGEFLVLLGPSGCGKSTLLHSIAGLVDITGGQVLIHDRDVSAAEPAERGIAMVFQSYALYPSMTVEQNLSFGLRVRGVPRAEVARRVRHASELLQIGPLLRRRPAQLSGGQRQRVAIGRALVREAEVFLLDEPLSSLDAQLRGELRRELKLLHARLGATIVYVTHDQVEALTLATRVVVMRDGTIQQVGTPREVYERPANRFVAGFVGSPPMNFIEGVIAHGTAGPGFAFDGQRLALDGYRWQAGAATGPAVLGIRPEALRIDAGGAWSGVVRVVEPLGAQQVVWLEMSGRTVAALAGAADPISPGGQVNLQPQAGAASVFDGRDGRRL